VSLRTNRWTRTGARSRAVNADSFNSDAFDATCALCGKPGHFARDEQPSRESYPCPGCRASLRYQGQALVVLAHYARHGSMSIKMLVREREFRGLHVWEPGQYGPFRRYLKRLPNYQRSGFWPDVGRGKRRDGVRCEDITETTFASEAFDLVLTSEVFEHVRKPVLGFREIHRILRAGGAHIFSIPVSAPVRPTTRSRVDTSGPDDVFLVEPEYHNTHLVYNDFGLDLVDQLADVGFHTEIVPFVSTNPTAARQVSFCSVKLS